MSKKKPASTLRRRAGEAASAGVHRATVAARKASAWARDRVPEPIPVSTIPATPPSRPSDEPGLLETVEDTILDRPIECLLGAALAGYVVGRLLG